MRETRLLLKLKEKVLKENKLNHKRFENNNCYRPSFHLDLEIAYQNVLDWIDEILKDATGGMDMNTETGFKVGDKVWYMSENRPVYTKVNSIEKRLCFGAETYLVYVCEDGKRFYKDSKDVFRTKMECVMSLL